MNHILSGARIIDIGKDGRNIFKWFISAYGMERRICFIGGIVDILLRD